jgi:MOSC domain-containing protein YiiM
VLGRPLRPGQFGENLTTSGIDLNEARAGDRWRVGGALLEIAGVRIPCSVFQGFLGEPRWVKRFMLARMPGPYLRVLEEGAVAAGDTIEVVERRDHDVTVQLMFRALTTERTLVPMLAAEPRIDSFVARRLGERRNDPAR